MNYSEMADRVCAAYHAIMNDGQGTQRLHTGECYHLGGRAKAPAVVVSSLMCAGTGDPNDTRLANMTHLTAMKLAAALRVKTRWLLFGNADKIQWIGAGAPSRPYNLSQRDVDDLKGKAKKMRKHVEVLVNRWAAKNKVPDNGVLKLCGSARLSNSKESHSVRLRTIENYARGLFHRPVEYVMYDMTPGEAERLGVPNEIAEIPDEIPNEVPNEIPNEVLNEVLNEVQSEKPDEKPDEKQKWECCGGEYVYTADAEGARIAVPDDTAKSVNDDLIKGIMAYIGKALLEAVRKSE